jgi:hypothetical protein
MDLDLKFEPFMTDDTCFYVYCDKNLVAAIQKVADGWRSMEGPSDRPTFKSALMAAFADANLTKETEFWMYVS